MECRPSSRSLPGSCASRKRGSCLPTRPRTIVGLVSAIYISSVVWLLLQRQLPHGISDLRLFTAKKDTTTLSHSDSLLIRDNPSSLKNVKGYMIAGRLRSSRNEVILHEKPPSTRVNGAVIDLGLNPATFTTLNHLRKDDDVNLTPQQSTSEATLVWWSHQNWVRQLISGLSRDRNYGDASVVRPPNIGRPAGNVATARENKPGEKASNDIKSSTAEGGDVPPVEEFLSRTSSQPRWVQRLRAGDRQRVLEQKAREEASAKDPERTDPQGMSSSSSSGSGRLVVSRSALQEDLLRFVNEREKSAAISLAEWTRRGHEWPPRVAAPPHLVDRMMQPPLNAGKFPEAHSPVRDGRVIVLYVHKRADYLEITLNALSKVHGINESLLIVR